MKSGPDPASPQRGASCAEPSSGGSGAFSWVVTLGIGFGGIILVAFYVHWHEAVVLRSLLHTTFASLTPIVLFLIFLVVAFLNPLLHRLSRRLAMGRWQLMCLVLLWSLTAVVCYTHLGGMALHVAGNVYSSTQESPSIRRSELKTYLEPRLFLDSAAARDYDRGIGTNVLARVRLADIPWRPWLRPLLYWLPLVVVIVLFSSSLIRMLHRQWAQNEMLSYPIANVFDCLIARGQDRALPDIFYNKVFRCGFLAITVVYVINGLHTWFPLMVEIPLSYWHKELLRNFPFVSRYCGAEAYSLFRGILYPWVACLAVFLPTDVSLSCWLGWVLMVLAGGFYFLSTGTVISPKDTEHLHAGMYAAMLAMILYTGRNEYRRILRLAFSPARTGDELLRGAVVACRLFAVGAVALVLLLAAAGLDWPVAVVVVAVLALNLIIAARFTAELGIPWLINLTGNVRLFATNLLGTAAIGPRGLAVLAVLSVVLDGDMRNSIAAQETHYGKLTEKQGRFRPRLRLNLILLAGLCVALTATVVVTLWDNYSFGARQEEPHSHTLKARMQAAGDQIISLRIEGKADAAGVSRLGAVHPEKGFWRFFLGGVALIVIVAAMRLRFLWWPFHPLPLLFFGEFCMGRLYPSFFLGWLIKVGLLKIGGGQFYTRVKPFFLGVIVGQVIVGGFWVLVGDAYYLLHHAVPPVTRFIM